jgi:hypothetical protein
MPKPTTSTSTSSVNSVTAPASTTAGRAVPLASVILMPTAYCTN